MSEAKFSTIQIKVRNYHLDFFQHVNNTRYLEFLEEARWAYTEQIEKEWFKHFGKSYAFVVVNINIDYLYPATMGDTIEIHTRIAKVGTTSAVYEQKIILAGSEKPVANAKVTLVLMDERTKRPAEIPETMRDILLKA
ncbi:MAG: thioesterase family protein [Bacteroidota bacterium]